MDGAKQLSAWQRRLERVSDPIERATRVSAMEFRKDVSRTFDRETDPYGNKWAKRTRKYSHGTLKKTLKLRKSWSVRLKSRTDIEFKSSDPKSIFHQEGWTSGSGSRVAPRASAPNSKGLPKPWAARLKRAHERALSSHFGDAS